MAKTMKLLCALAVFCMFFSNFLTGNIVEAAAVTANDKYFANQSYLKQIKADRAWETYRENTAITIAVLDTGVDIDHPDLAPNLLPGINLVKPGASVNDDNGHGTQVIGILAAKGNNGIGVTGVLWNARVLPIKVLDRNAQARLDVLAKGINQAIDRGAKIILTSVSSTSTSNELERAVQRAEASGVLIIAAAGNEADRVTYPAAYPTVVSVGAVQANNTPLYQSNTGPELNIMAPGWKLYTTERGGTYGPMSGTSAAAPQVAGAAALILAKHPKMKPLDVRQLLYQTATELGQDGWDRKTGYGLLNVYAAVRTTPSLDFHEPNDTQSRATPFPIESQLRGRLSANDPVDWYYVDVPYAGKTTFTSLVTSHISTSIAATFYVDGRQPATYYLGNGDTLSIPSKDGRMYIKLERSGGVNAFTYVLTSEFAINPDSYERNDNQTQARPLPPGNRISVIGNFHQDGDRDWFSYYVREQGRMQVEVSPDNKRMDPVMTISKEGTNLQKEYDSGTRDNPDEKATLDVSPGKYFIRVYEYSGKAINGEYRLDLNYTPIRKDTNEPNDNYLQATKLGNGTLLTGTLASKNDYDWFQFQLDYESYVTIRAPFIPVQSGVNLHLYTGGNVNYPLFSETDVAQLSDAGKTIMGMKLNPGTYYIRLHSYVPFQYDAYRVTMTRERLIAGYRDIASHWARADIARLSLKGVVKGFPDYTFRPDQAVTRAQFASMLMQAMKEKGQVPAASKHNPFVDIKSSHWAYQPMMQAYQLGILQGYSDSTVRPNKLLSRAEMAVMVARAKNVLMYNRSYATFRDVPANHWAAPAIEALTSKGWISGYGSGTFKPGGIARRAEMVVLLGKAYQL